MSEHPVDVKLAQPLIDKYYIRKIVEENGKPKMVPFSCGDSIENFQKFGEGTYFYFLFLKYFAIICLILGLSSIFPLYILISENNDSIESGANFFVRTMIANVPQFEANRGDSLIYCNNS